MALNPLKCKYHLTALGLKGLNKAAFVSGLSAVSAMAVDWLAKNLYILDVELKQIIVCSLQKVVCTLLNRNISYGNLRSVAVDPAAG